MPFRILTTGTVEEQIGELDALVDDLKRKPRKEITNIVNQIPGGCLMEPVVSDLDIFVGFFTVAGVITNLVAQLPMDAKVCTLAIKSVVDNITTSVGFQVSKGQNSLPGPIELAANAKVSVSINTSDILSSVVFGYIFTPTVS